MNCKKLKRYLVDFLDGELPEQERTAFLTHYQACVKCQDRWGYQLKLSKQLSASLGTFKKELEVPRALFYDILREIRNIPEPKPLLGEVLAAAFRIPQVAYASLILILGVAIAFNLITIMKMDKIHPATLLAKERIVPAHIYRAPLKSSAVYWAKGGLTRGSVYFEIRSSFRPKVQSKFFIERSGA